MKNYGFYFVLFVCFVTTKAGADVIEFQPYQPTGDPMSWAIGTVINASSLARPEMFSQNLSTATYVARGVAEFDISTIPVGSTIASATLTITETNDNVSTSLSGYVGDGALTTTDFASTETLLQANISDGVVNQPAINISAEFIQQLVDNGDQFAGFRIVSSATTDPSVYYGAYENGGTLPTLQVEFTAIPEPATFTLVALGMVGLLATSRRRNLRQA